MAAYSNWLGLMKRSLAVSIDKGSNKGGAATRRELQPARYRTSPITGERVELKGQALLLARNVGMHMLTDMVTTSHTNEPVPEHFVDALVTAAAALHDVRGHRANSRHGSIYVVKPKMHGAEEAALAATLMGRVEQARRWGFWVAWGLGTMGMGRQPGSMDWGGNEGHVLGSNALHPLHRCSGCPRTRSRSE